MVNISMRHSSNGVTTITTERMARADYDRIQFNAIESFKNHKVKDCELWTKTFSLVDGNSYIYFVFWTEEPPTAVTQEAVTDPQQS